MVFVAPRDYQYYLGNLAERKAELGLKVFSHCLMTNHVHLVAEAGNDRSGIGPLMKRLAGRQTRSVNKMEGRKGPLWESRYKISPIDSGACLLQCCRYVELNPVEARMASGPEQHEWSNYRAVLGEADCDWLDVSPPFEASGDDMRSSIERYAAFVGDFSAAEKEASLI